MANVLAWFSLVLFLTFNPIQCCPLVLEKGLNESISCPYTNNVTDIIWQKSDGQKLINVSTCSYVTSTCSNQMPSKYQAQVSSSFGSQESTIDILSVGRNEAQLFCATNTGQRTNLCDLFVYAWPQTPTCSEHLTNTYLDIDCVTQNFYPNVEATLSRRQVILRGTDILSSSCKLGLLGSGSEGDYSANCTWRIPIENLNPSNTFYVEMVVVFPPATSESRLPVTSNDITTDLIAPEVVVYQRNCPVGPGVKSDVININTDATCKCELAKSGMPRGFARWYTKDGRIVGVENSTEGSSTLYLSYSVSDPTPTFQCKPISPLTSLTVTSQYYTPKFTSSETTDVSETKPDNLAIIVGLAVGISALALVAAVTTFIVIRRRRPRPPFTQPAHPPQWVNTPDHQVSLGFDKPPEYSTYVTPIGNNASERPYSNIYSSINPVDEYITLEANMYDATFPDAAPRPHAPRPYTNDAFKGDYGQPIG